MAKLGKKKAALAALAQKSVFVKADPVTGADTVIARKPSTVATSEKLIKFRKCMQEGMSEFKATGATAKERSLSVRKAFTAQAKKCKS